MSKRIQQLKFHKELLKASLFNLNEIKKAYASALSIEGIKHLSLNIVNPAGELLFLSSTPYTGINVCGSDLWKYDSSISPNNFCNNSFFWWDDCYDKRKFNSLKCVKESCNGINSGFVFVKHVKDFYILISYGSSFEKECFSSNVESNQKKFLDLADESYKKVLPLYLRYCVKFQPPTSIK